MFYKCPFSQNVDPHTQTWPQEAWNLYGRQQVKLFDIYNVHDNSSEDDGKDMNDNDDYSNHLI